jgi:hypothetical protein
VCLQAADISAHATVVTAVLLQAFQSSHSLCKQTAASPAHSTTVAATAVLTGTQQVPPASSAMDTNLCHHAQSMAAGHDGCLVHRTSARHCKRHLRSSETRQQQQQQQWPRSTAKTPVLTFKPAGAGTPSNGTSVCRSRRTRHNP